MLCYVFRNRRNISSPFLVVKVKVSGSPTSQSDSDRRSNIAKRDISTARDREMNVKTPEPGADHPCAKCVHPEPFCLGVAGRPGAQWRWREVDLEVQTTKTLIEPRLEELPGLPGRVLELNDNNKFLSTSSTTTIGKRSAQVIYCLPCWSCVCPENYIISRHCQRRRVTKRPRACRALTTR